MAQGVGTHAQDPAGFLQEPAEQLRTVDFSSLKFKEDKRTGGRSASSAVSGASAAPTKAGDVFLAKPTPETGSGEEAASALYFTPLDRQ